MLAAIALAVAAQTERSCADVKGVFRTSQCCEFPDGAINGSHLAPLCASTRSAARYSPFFELLRVLYTDLPIASLNSQIEALTGVNPEMVAFDDKRDFLHAAAQFYGYADTRPELSSVPSERFPDSATLGAYLDSFPSDHVLEATMKKDPSDEIWNVNRRRPYRLPFSNSGYRYGPFEVQPFSGLGLGMSIICQERAGSIECMVLDVLEDSSAAAGGVLPGDRVLRWQGEPIGERNVPDVYFTTKTQTQLTVQTIGGSPRNATLTASPLREDLHGIRHAVYDSPSGKVGYVLYRYQTQPLATTYVLLDRIYREFADAGVVRVVVDLRGDTRGGDLEYAVMRAAINGDVSFQGMPELQNGHIRDVQIANLNSFVASSPQLVNGIFGGTNPGLPGQYGTPGETAASVAAFFQERGGVPYLNSTGALQGIDVLQSIYQGSAPEYTIAILRQRYGANVIGDTTLGLAHAVLLAPYAADGTLYAMEIVSNAHEMFDVRMGGIVPDEQVDNDFFRTDRPFRLGDPEHDPVLAHALHKHGVTTGGSARRRLSAPTGTPVGAHPMLRLSPSIARLARATAA